MNAQHSTATATPRVGSRQGAMPFAKYHAFPPVVLPDRRWPGNVLDAPPRWCSVDLRDGNQALIDPMNVDEKLRLFELLLEVGFVEIEAGFPAASQPDFDFIRAIIDRGMVPNEVAIQVLCQARAELIERTVEALDGAPNAIFHLYNSTSTLQRRVVFQLDRAGVVALAVEGAAVVKEGVRQLSGTNVQFEYSPESFTGTELDFAVEISAAVADEMGCHARRADHRQPAVHRGEWRRRTSTPTRSSGSSATSPTASASSSACTPTTTAAPAWRPPNSR